MMIVVIFLCLAKTALSAVANCNGVALTNDQRDKLTNIHNQIRSAVANGAAPYLAGNLNAGKNMYKLKYSCAIEDAAAAAMSNTCKQTMVTPAKYGQNVQAYVTPTIIAVPLDDLLEDAVKQWYLPILRYGLSDPNNKYTDPRLESFANVVFYKNTEFGCHYAECQNPNRKVIVCMYNNVIKPNDLIYEKGTPCQADTDCTTYSPSTCDRVTSLCETAAQNPVAPIPGMCANAEMTDPIRQKILDMHNWRRSQVALGNIRNGRNPYNCPQASNMNRMKYDCTLEDTALAYARQCSLMASSIASRPGEGENVHSGPLVQDKLTAAETAVKSWWSQIFKNGLNQKMLFTTTLRDKANAPLAFTQMAWASSIKIGCAVYDCAPNTFTVCRYKDQGNIVNQQIYRVGRPCSSCSTSCSPAEGLCS